MKLTWEQLTGNRHLVDVEPKDKIKEVKLKLMDELEINQKVSSLWKNTKVS